MTVLAEIEAEGCRNRDILDAAKEIDKLVADGLRPPDYLLFAVRDWYRKQRGNDRYGK